MKMRLWKSQQCSQGLNVVPLKTKRNQNCANGSRLYECKTQLTSFYFKLIKVTTIGIYNPLPNSNNTKCRRKIDAKHLLLSISFMSHFKNEHFCSQKSPPPLPQEIMPASGRHIAGWGDDLEHSQVGHSLLMNIYLPGRGRRKCSAWVGLRMVRNNS